MERSLALDVAYLGVAGTEFTQCVDVDTVTFNFSDAKELSFTSMGHEDPWAVVSRKGDPSSIEFTIPSPTSDEMKMFCGGTVSGDKWEAPLSTPSIRLQSLPYQGKFTEYVFVKCSVFGKISQAPDKENCDLLLVKATIMTPVSAAGKQASPYSRAVKVVSEDTE